METNDYTLKTLLDLNDEIFKFDNGFWTKFEAHLVDPTEAIPHGIRYSLTLHDCYNRRILGFDNAHAYKPKTKKYGARKVTWDHRHRREKVYPYEYESASQLIADFGMTWSRCWHIMRRKAVGED